MVFQASQSVTLVFLTDAMDRSPAKHGMGSKNVDVMFIFHTVDTVHLRHIKLRYKPTDAH
jgi:hypothetical protein